jgi:hypothetical protein
MVSDGSVARQVLPSSLGVVTCYDSNGRVAWVSPDRSEDECKAWAASKTYYADGVSYWPHGAVKGLTLG